MYQIKALRSHGSIFEVYEETLPPLKAEEVLIEVKAAGLNRADILQRQGLYPPPPQASHVLGLEVAGRVVAVGSRVSCFTHNDRVMALLDGGGYATYCKVDQGLCFPIPLSLNFLQAACLPEGLFTIWNSFFERDFLHPEETLLIHGGSSGIGTLAIQTAKALGARVAVTVKNQEKAQVCRQLGAEKVIIYPEENFEESVLHWTQGRGVDVILDCVGKDYLAHNIGALGFRGRLVQIACQKGAKGELNLLTMLKKQLVITGCTLRDRPLEEKRIMAKRINNFIMPKVSRGLILPYIYAKFSFDNVAEAHQLLESQSHIGKIVVSLE